MHVGSRAAPQGSFLEFYIRNGRQAFFQPTTVPLPTGISLNSYGWLDCPTTGLVIPIVSIRSDEKRTLYWFSEKIVTNSSNVVRMSLEGNFQYDEALGDWPEDTWTTTAGYAITASKDHIWNGLAPIKTVPGDALRLRVFAPESGNVANQDFYFKFIALDLPWIDDGSII